MPACLLPQLDDADEETQAKQLVKAKQDGDEDGDEVMEEVEEEVGACLSHSACDRDSACAPALCSHSIRFSQEEEDDLGGGDYTALYEDDDEDNDEAFGENGAWPCSPAVLLCMPAC